MACAVLAAHAGAQAQAQPTEYRELVRQALAEFDAKNWVQARTLFRAAHAAQPSARTLRGLGMVAFEMQEYVDAHEQLGAALRDPRKPLDSALRAETAALLQRTRAMIGRVRLAIAPPDATIRLNGSRVEPGTRELWMRAGGQMIRAEAVGYQPQIIELDIQGGDDIQVEVDLERASIAGAGVPAPHDRSRAVAESLATAPGDEHDRDGDAITQKWWFWVGAGALAVGIGTAVALLASRGEEQEPVTKGTGDVVIVTLSLP
jgi:hypothetical protein